jgi:hypothetical protein
LLIGASAGCFEPSSGPSAAADRTSVSANREAAGLGDQIAQLRAATARFHDLEAAKDAGYNVALTACYEDEVNGEGAMGYHYGKPSIINATVNQLEPEALLYEPQKNGRPRLVGVEYIVPFTVVSEDSPPPRAFGLNFKKNFVFNVWALHVWVWKNNPSGIFADWNPNVTCDNAPDASLNISHSH